MVVTAFLLDDETGNDWFGEVQVAICARRRTVSKGNLMDKSSAELANVATLQLAVFIAGSRPKYDFRKTGVLVEISAGKVEVRNVIGIRCVGIK